MALLVYVDDVILVGMDALEIAAIKHKLDSLFLIKGLGPWGSVWDLKWPVHQKEF